MASEFVEPGEELSQGDLILEAPSVYVRSLSYMVATGKNTYMLQHRAPAAERQDRVGQANVREDLEREGEDALGNAVGARRPGLVLSHNCELDKTAAKRSVLVAHVRPMVNMPDEAMERVREFREKRAFYLPACERLDGEHFADLRSITMLLREEVIDRLERVATLNEEGLQMLQSQLFRFFVRKRLPAEWTGWPDEAENEVVD